MSDTTDPGINNKGMENDGAYVSVKNAGAHLDHYDSSDETVQRVTHTLELRNNEKLKNIDQEFILKGGKVYVDHVSDAYTLAMKTMAAIEDAYDRDALDDLVKYATQFFAITQYVKLFRSNSAWTEQTQGTFENASLLYRFEDSLDHDVFYVHAMLGNKLKDMGEYHYYADALRQLIALNPASDPS